MIVIKYILVNVFCSIIMTLLFPLQGISALIPVFFSTELTCSKGRKTLRNSSHGENPSGETKKEKAL